MTLSHINDNNQPQMVDVGGKSITQRMAHARAIMQLPDEVASHIKDGDIESAKGPVFQTAIIAGTMGAKKTSDLIPMCHPIGLDSCTIDIHTTEHQQVVIDCRCKVEHKTGVEMEALTGATIAALTIYDMCKGLSHNILIKDVHLVEKRGGKRDVVQELS